MVSYLEDGVALVRQIRELNIPSLLARGAGGFTLDTFWDQAGTAAEGMVTATLWFRPVKYSGESEVHEKYRN